MIDFFSRDDIQLKLVSLVAFQCGILFLQQYWRKEKYRTKIEEVQKAPIYEFEEFKKEVQKFRNSSKPIQVGHRNDSVRSLQTKTFFVKMTPKNEAFIKHEEQIYSNQIKLCPPSQNQIWKNVLKYHEQHSKVQPIKLSQIAQKKYQLFQGKILTDKISCQTVYKPNPSVRIDSNGHAFTILKKAASVFLQKGCQIILHCLQYFLQKLTLRTAKRRSYDDKRSPFFKGISAGSLISNFSFLAGSNFLLKINLEGNQLSTEFIADNKLAIIDFYSSRIKESQRKSTIAACISIGGLAFMIYRLRPWLQIYWKHFTSTQQKKLNPSGVSDDKLCQICYINCRNVVFQKCRHIIVCEECFYHLDQKRCIICNEIIEKNQIIYPKQS